VIVKLYFLIAEIHLLMMFTELSMHCTQYALTKFVSYVPFIDSFVSFIEHATYTIQCNKKARTERKMSKMFKCKHRN